MWLMTPIGFFSIVRKPNDVASGTLTIRSRVRSDLEALRERYLPDLSEIAENAGTDYRYRTKAPRSDVIKAISKIVQDLGNDLMTPARPPENSSYTKRLRSMRHVSASIGMTPRPKSSVAASDAATETSGRQFDMPIEFPANMRELARAVAQTTAHIWTPKANRYAQNGEFA